MCNTITININVANKAQKYETKEELFQIEAFDKVATILEEHHVGSNTSEITDCRFHDTIFIDGDRGVGKTAFMINIQHYYETFYKVEEADKKLKYIFLKPIDPTLLEHTEKFLSVVLARIVEYVNDEKNNIHDSKRYEFYKSLENLSKSLSAIKTLPEDIGIDEIASNKSSLKLEQYAHEFFKEVCFMYDVNSIIILIDDVDMAFDKGFDVLEVVRKYLASPYVITIVAGDMNLYREIVETRFMEKIRFQEDIASFSNTNQIFKQGCVGIEENKKNWGNETLGCNQEVLHNLRHEYKNKKFLVDNLVKQYLEKIFPNEYHVKLKNIFRILKANKVSVKFREDLVVPYTEIKDFEIRHINLGINQVKFTYQVFSDNTRDLVQYLYSKKEIYIKFFESNKDYPKELMHKKYVPQNVIKKYDIQIMDMIFNNSVIYKKSLESTSQFYEYYSGKQKELSLLTDNDVKASEHGRYNIYNAFLGRIFDENSKLSAEKSTEDIAIYYEDFEKVEALKDGKTKYIVDLFVHSNYYSNKNQTKNYIFGGSFIELMFFSLTSNMKLDIAKDKNIEEIVNFNEAIVLDNSLNIIFTQIKECYQLDRVDVLSVPETLDEIAHKLPFNSIFRKNKNFEDSSKTTEEEEEVSTSISHNKNDLENLSIEILVWRNAFLDDIKINSISMYEIMHKFFNNLNLLKTQKLINETPLTFMQRIIFIFINAVAFFENTNLRVAETNIAMVSKFTIDKIIDKTNAFNQNIKPLLNQKSLTRALFFHPIISHILFPDEGSKLMDLRFTNQKPKNYSSHKDTKNIKIKEDEKLYLELQKKTQEYYDNEQYIEMFRITYTLLSSDDFTNKEKEYSYPRIYRKNARWYKAFIMLSDNDKIKIDNSLYEYTNMKFNA